MNFDLDQIHQSGMPLHRFEMAFYEKLAPIAEKHPNWIRPIGLFIAVGSALKQLACLVAFVVESSIRAIADIFGSLVFEQCDFKRGLVQLFFAIFTTPFASIKIIFDVFKITLGIALNPKKAIEKEYEYFKKVVDNYDLNKSTFTFMKEEWRKRMGKGDSSQQTA